MATDAAVLPFVPPSTILVVDDSATNLQVLVRTLHGRHGAPAAIVMAMIRAVVHTCPSPADDPPALQHHINRHFKFLWDTAMYATATYGVLDAGRRTLRIASAGHPQPLLVRGGTVSPLAFETMMCVLWDELGDVPCSEHALAPGDRLAFFTDGITDRQAPDGTMFDLERLSEALARAGARTPPQVVEAIVGELDSFAGGQEPDDDQTLLVVGIE